MYVKRPLGLSIVDCISIHVSKYYANNGGVQRFSSVHECKILDRWFSSIAVGVSKLAATLRITTSDVCFSVLAIPPHASVVGVVLGPVVLDVGAGDNSPFTSRTGTHGPSQSAIFAEVVRLSTGKSSAAIRALYFRLGCRGRRRHLSIGTLRSHLPNAARLKVTAAQSCHAVCGDTRIAANTSCIYGSHR